MKLLIFAFLVCFAVCVLATPGEDETVGSFDSSANSYDPRHEAEFIKTILKLKKKLIG
ncbi:CLUMA_CG001402, isoform A [Clunio marinus]|uniref:CLUMA_CG001402, isoform A n=1 Tax=Clunio marinus TaxID=568069 RepID=A0A1J1HMC4_9DIPT|nr:CLUMA_CG001402, isoform A [Clunio marinus]